MTNTEKQKFLEIQDWCCRMTDLTDDDEADAILDGLYRFIDKALEFDWDKVISAG
jgi:hypothetical protein